MSREVLGAGPAVDSLEEADRPLDLDAPTDVDDAARVAGAPGGASAPGASPHAPRGALPGPADRAPGDAGAHPLDPVALDRDGTGTPTRIPGGAHPAPGRRSRFALPRPTGRLAAAATAAVLVIGLAASAGLAAGERRAKADAQAARDRESRSLFLWLANDDVTGVDVLSTQSDVATGTTTLSVRLAVQGSAAVTVSEVVAPLATFTFAPARLVRPGEVVDAVASVTTDCNRPGAADDRQLAGAHAQVQAAAGTTVPVVFTNSVSTLVTRISMICTSGTPTEPGLGLNGSEIAVIDLRAATDGSLDFTLSGAGAAGSTFDLPAPDLPGLTMTSSPRLPVTLPVSGASVAVHLRFRYSCSHHVAPPLTDDLLMPTVSGPGTTDLSGWDIARSTSAVAFAIARACR